ncbi:transposase DNA-binding-containing protein [Mesorhizobium sp.]|uniref:transposase DNA-binding-containing protein n=1 Tax=Mesorhizobium sp. TaxID=1871066 RepID=UPI00257E3668|nr:transposase DNA-binding-containing protein [Mesorhizobium sp.]
MACQDWANTKAAYRFFSSDRVSEGETLAGHSNRASGQMLTDQGLPLAIRPPRIPIFERGDRHHIWRFSALSQPKKARISSSVSSLSGLGRPVLTRHRNAGRVDGMGLN